MLQKNLHFRSRYSLGFVNHFQIKMTALQKLQKYMLVIESYLKHTKSNHPKLMLTRIGVKDFSYSGHYYIGGSFGLDNLFPVG